MQSPFVHTRNPEVPHCPAATSTSVPSLHPAGGHSFLETVWPQTGDHNLRTKLKYSLDNPRGPDPGKAILKRKEEVIHGYMATHTYDAGIFLWEKLEPRSRSHEASRSAEKSKRLKRQVPSHKDHPQRPRGAALGQIILGVLTAPMHPHSSAQGNCQTSWILIPSPKSQTEKGQVETPFSSLALPASILL